MEIRKVCKRCGQEFVIDERTQEYYKERGWQISTKCAKCTREYREMLIAKDELNLQDKVCKCATCGNEYVVKWETQLNCKIKKWEEPKHCKECSIKRKGYFNRG